MGKVIITGAVPIIVLLIAVNEISGLDGNNGTVAGIVSAVWGGIWLVAANFTWYRYNRDEWVVTTQRLIDSVKHHWFHHEISSADLIQIEDMSVSRSGLLQTMFNFGDLRCQTAEDFPIGIDKIPLDFSLAFFRKVGLGPKHIFPNLIMFSR